MAGCGNWYPWFPGDFSRDTKGLSHVEKSVYRELLDHYYSTGEALPTSRDSLRRIAVAMSSEERAAVDLVVAKFFKPGDDGLLHNKRADKQLAEISATRTRLAEAGQRRWHKPKDKPLDEPLDSIGSSEGSCKGTSEGSCHSIPKAGANPPPPPHPQQQPQPRTTSSSPVKPVDPGAVRLSELLLAEIRARVPDSRQPNMASWAKEFDRLLRLDGRREDEAADLIRWVQADPFWGPNVMSPSKLREQWDRLQLKRLAVAGSAAVACSAAQRDKYAHLEEPC